MCRSNQVSRVQVDMKTTDQQGRGKENLKNCKSRLYSNNPQDCCRIFCCFCDKVVSLSGLGKHINNTHQVSLKEYKALFGNPRHQIIKLVFHKCSLCRNVILLNTDDLSKHMRKAHQTSFKDYLVRFMTNSRIGKQEFQQPFERETASNNEMKEDRVVIQCATCRKTFKQNIQLKIHMKKHSS